VNVALNRPSYLISTFHEYLASKANDGDKTNCDGHQTGFSICASSLSEFNPWYVVDLRVALQVNGVKIASDTRYGNIFVFTKESLRLIFTALHGMQTRSSDENSVRLSVCLTVRLSHAWIVTKR